MLSLFANLIYYFSGEMALFHTLMSWACPGRAGRVPDESWASPRRELDVSQTRAGSVPDEWGESRPRILIVKKNPLFLSVCVSVSVTKFSEVLPHFFPPPSFHL